MNIPLTPEHKANLLEALSVESTNPAQTAVIRSLQSLVALSKDSDELINYLKAGSLQLSEAVGIVMQELKIEPKENIDIVTIDQQGAYAKTAPNKPKGEL